jgi:hypothetical protein
MVRLGAVLGALAIMMSSGMIADFELSESDSDLVVRVWSPDGQEDAKLRKHVAALLPHYIERVVVVKPASL